MHKNTTKCNETLSKWCKNRHGASKIMDTLETYHLAIKENLDLRLMDVVTTYLYGSLDSDIYMKLPKGFKIPEAGSREQYSIKLNKSLYGLKQSGRMTRF
jgi:hypothetical protein